MEADDGLCPMTQLLRLGMFLTRARLNAGLTEEKVTAALNWPRIKLLRIESGSTAISTNDLQALIHCYGGLDIDQIEELVELARSAREQKGYDYRNVRPGEQLWQTISQDDFQNAIDAQLASANLIISPASNEARPRAKSHFHTNEYFWAKVLGEELRANAAVTLENFLLFEWFPRSPGLFHTKRGKMARAEAAYHLSSLNAPAGAFYENTERLSPVVYDLHGKAGMLAGGVGCIRLQPKQTVDGTLWFMSASSSRSAHEGIPLAMYEQDYDSCIGYITRNGAQPCTLTGRLRFLPKPLLSLYQDYADVPLLYLLVEKVEPVRASLPLRAEPPVVSVAVTFKTSGARCSAAYVSFVPGRNGTMRQRLQWLDDYVTDRHGGTVVTDFDEQARRFSGAVFSLKKIFSGNLDQVEIEPVVNNNWYYTEGAAIQKLMSDQRSLDHYRIHIEEMTVAGDVFNNIGAGVVINNRSRLANAMNITSQPPDPEIAVALKVIANAIAESRNAAAIENFNAFNEELQLSAPRKHLLKSFWAGVVSALPDIATLADATDKIIKLFH